MKENVEVIIKLTNLKRLILYSENKMRDRQNGIVDKVEY